MKFSSCQSMILLSVLSSTTNAIPLLWSAKNLIARAPQPQSYSVVAVDGGSTSTSAAASVSTEPPVTKTVTDAVTQLQTATILSTIPASPSSTIVTIIASQTITMTDSSAPTTVTATATEQPSVTSVPYDDGQWHTTYYFKSTAVAAADQMATTSASSASTTTSVDLGQWAYWAERNGNNGAA